MAMKRLSFPTLPRISRQTMLQAALAAFTLAWTFPATAFAQEDPCTFDLCALRVSGKEVRRGKADERVDGFSFWGGAPELPMLSGRADSAGINYEVFRKLNTRGVRLQSVALAASLAGLIVTVADQDNIGWGLGITIAGYVPLIWGASYHRRASDCLSRAIWWYNREL